MGWNWRGALPYLPFVTVAMVMIAVLVIVIARIANPAAPPLRYTQDVYQPERAVYAPGETMVYTATLTVERAGAIHIVRGWRTLPGHARARLCDGSNAPVLQDTPPPFPPEAVDSEVEGRIVVTVPNLPPGRYVLVTSATKDDGGETVTQAPMEVRAPCLAG